MKGYKVFNPDWTCRGFQYEVGKEYRHEGEIGLCKSGFHFCERLVDCFNYYKFDPKNKVAEIEAFGYTMSNKDKSVTNGIKIIKELSWYEVLSMVNTGNCNTGYRNSGDCNSGDRNSGDRNSGNWNSGDCNSGECNTGDWNATNNSSGFFNTIEQPLFIFNKPTNISKEEIYNNPTICAMYRHFILNKWITKENMSDEEKIHHPEYEDTGGYSKTYKYKESCTNMWAEMTEEEKDGVWDIPNFDPEIFFEITGIRVEPREVSNGLQETRLE